MTPLFLCLIVLVMPLAVAVCAVFTAWVERRPDSAKVYRLNIPPGDGVADVDDDSTLFR